MADARKRRCDAVVVYRYDRFARSLRQLVNALAEFEALGIHFISIHEGIDTSMPNGRLVFGIFGSIAEFERELIRDRVRSGLAAAKAKGERRKAQGARRKAQGTRLGRPPLRELTPRDKQQLRRDRTVKKLPFASIAQKYVVSVWTAFQLCKRSRLEKE
jgi:DNA invertase Pin-like site-specific DNA recombinase